MSNESHQSFFRQSAWLMVANVAGGVFMFGVHFFSKKIPDAEYGILGTMLALLNCMAIPTLGLQMVFAQQTAAALTLEQQKQLAATTRALLMATLTIWVAMAVTIAIFRNDVLATLKISNPAVLWVTIGLGLVTLWQPIFSGLLQGFQNFLWLGWASILSGMGRFASVAVIVLVFSGWAAGIMTGALIGGALALALSIRQTRHVWFHRGTFFEWKPWVARVIPLTLGFGSYQFMFSADPIFVQTFFDGNETGYYMSAGTLARALVLFTGPLAAVMFPRIVRGLAKSEKTDMLKLTLITTGALATVGAIMLSSVAPVMIEFVFKKNFIAQAAPLLPWFSGSMVILAMANVLTSNLMARERFDVVPFLLLVAVAYAAALTVFNDSFLTVIWVQGTFNLLYLAIWAWFTWRQPVAKVAN